jgi:hypothetical protein
MLPNEIKKAVIAIQECIDQTQKLPEIAMEVVNDLLYSN